MAFDDDFSSSMNLPGVSIRKFITPTPGALKKNTFSITYSKWGPVLNNHPFMGKVVTVY